MFKATYYAKMDRDGERQKIGESHHQHNDAFQALADARPKAEYIAKLLKEQAGIKLYGSIEIHLAFENPQLLLFNLAPKKIDEALPDKPPREVLDDPDYTLSTI